MIIPKYFPAVEMQVEKLQLKRFLNTLIPKSSLMPLGAVLNRPFPSLNIT